MANWLNVLFLRDVSGQRGYDMQRGATGKDKDPGPSTSAHAAPAQPVELPDTPKGLNVHLLFYFQYYVGGKKVDTFNSK